MMHVGLYCEVVEEDGTVNVFLLVAVRMGELHGKELSKADVCGCYLP